MDSKVPPMAPTAGIAAARRYLKPSLISACIREVLDYQEWVPGCDAAGPGGAAWDFNSFPYGFEYRPDRFFFSGKTWEEKRAEKEADLRKRAGSPRWLIRGWNRCRMNGPIGLLRRLQQQSLQLRLSEASPF